MTFWFLSIECAETNVRLSFKGLLRGSVSHHLNLLYGQLATWVLMLHQRRIKTRRALSGSYGRSGALRRTRDFRRRKRLQRPIYIVQGEVGRPLQKGRKEARSSFHGSSQKGCWDTIEKGLPDFCEWSTRCTLLLYIVEFKMVLFKKDQ